MKIIIASDHAGFQLKESIKKWLEEWKYEVEDLGAHSYKPKDDYPDFIIPAAKRVAKLKTKGIILGGSGQGEAIAANKVKGIRTAVYYGGNKKILKLSREHNDANILSLGARFISKPAAREAVKLWLKTSFKKGRHAKRIKKIEK